MKFLRWFLIFFYPIMLVQYGYTQDQQGRIDSLVSLLETAGREWNTYADQLIDIGEPAVPALIRTARDRSLEQWNRRITIMTLNTIHSRQWVEPALMILFDPEEDPATRNQVTAGLKGFDLTDVKEELWNLFEDVPNAFHQLNIAHLLLDADTAMAYQAFLDLYERQDGYIQKTALLNLVLLRPHESTSWFIKGIQLDDWMTANMAMDSLVSTHHFLPEDLQALYHDPGTDEEVRWRIVHVFSHRNEPESVPLLLHAFRDESWLVHTEATVGLSRFDPEQILPEMRSMKDDPAVYVRNNSRWVIKQLQGRK